MSHRLLVKDNRGERELLLLDSIVVGRDPRCDISQADPQLSRRHARFSVSDRGVVVQDLNSRNGLLVNGRRVLEALLHPGDVVQVAALAITFLRASEPEAVSLPSHAPPARPAAPSASDGVPVAQAELPFAAVRRDEERTTLMSPDQVAAAAIASLPERGDRPAKSAAPSASAEASSAATAVGVAPPVLPETASGEPPEAVPALAPAEGLPITGSGGSAWAATLTWQVATLALVCFFAGAVSMLPWRVGAVPAGGWDGAIALLAPLAGLVASLALGLTVAASLRRSTAGAVRVARPGGRSERDPGRADRP